MDSSHAYVRCGYYSASIFIMSNIIYNILVGGLAFGSMVIGGAFESSCHHGLGVITMNSYQIGIGIIVFLSRFMFAIRVWGIAHHIEHPYVAHDIDICYFLCFLPVLVVMIVLGGILIFHQNASCFNLNEDYIFAIVFWAIMIFDVIATLLRLGLYKYYDWTKDSLDHSIESDNTPNQDRIRTFTNTVNPPPYTETSKPSV